MQPGSIIELTRDLTNEDLRLLAKHGVRLTKNTPYVIKDGPKQELWRGRIAVTILLEEEPHVWVNSQYFSELQAPGEVSLSEILAELMKVAV